MDDRIIGLLDPAGCRPGASGEAVERLQAALGQRLPGDYLKFLRHTDGYEGAVGEGGYPVFWAADTIPVLNCSYHVQEFAPGLVVIGSNGANSAYAIDTTPAGVTGGQYVEADFITMGHESIFFRARTLLEFLQHIGAGEQPGDDVQTA